MEELEREENSLLRSNEYAAKIKTEGSAILENLFSQTETLKVCGAGILLYNLLACEAAHDSVSQYCRCIVVSAATD